MTAIISFEATVGDQGGFTLIEVMVSIALLAVLMGLALPSFSSLIDRNQVESAMSEYVFAIRSARSVAIGRGAPTYLCPSSNASSQTPSCGNSASWEDGFIIYSKPAYTSSRSGFLAFDDSLDELITQLNFSENVTGKLTVEEVNASEYIGFSNIGAIIQPSPNANPAVRICGAAGGKSIGTVYRLSTVGRLSVVKATNEECNSGVFS